MIGAVAKSVEYACVPARFLLLYVRVCTRFNVALLHLFEEGERAPCRGVCPLRMATKLRQKKKRFEGGEK